MNARAVQDPAPLREEVLQLVERDHGGLLLRDHDERGVVAERAPEIAAVQEDGAGHLAGIVQQGEFLQAETGVGVHDREVVGG